MVRPPGFEVPNRCLDGFPGRWVGSPLDAAQGYVLDQARLRPLTMRLVDVFSALRLAENTGGSADGLVGDRWEWQVRDKSQLVLRI